MNVKERYEALKNTVRGGGSRAEYLAYAFLRRRPYRGLELRVREHNEPSSTAIYDALHGERVEWWKLSVVERVDKLEAIKTWLLEPATEEMTSSWAAKRESYLEQKRRMAAERKKVSA